LQVGRFYPNPFNPIATLDYVLSRAGAIRVVIYDASGRHVRTLVDRIQSYGPQQAIWDGRDDAGREMSSGVYFARLEAAGDERVRKMVLLK
jgi:flagellar hook assembly protein FlgD